MEKVNRYSIKLKRMSRASNERQISARKEGHNIFFGERDYFETEDFLESKS